MNRIGYINFEHTQLYYLCKQNGEQIRFATLELLRFTKEQTHRFQQL